MIQQLFNANQTDYIWPVHRLWQWGGQFSFLLRELPLIQENCVRHGLRTLLQKSSLMVFAPRGNKFASFEDFYTHIGRQYCVVSRVDIPLIHDGIDRW